MFARMSINIGNGFQDLAVHSGNPCEIGEDPALFITHLCRLCVVQNTDPAFFRRFAPDDLFHRDRNGILTDFSERDRV